jgi:fructose-specific phosphotransferase system IIC component
VRDSTNFGRTLDRVAIYMAEIVLISVLGFACGAISGAVVTGPTGSLVGGILGGLLAAWFAGRLISPFSR